MTGFVNIKDANRNLWIKKTSIVGVYTAKNQDIFNAWNVVVNLNDGAKYILIYENRETAEQEVSKLLNALN